MNPINFVDKNGLNTLDDFNYQKRTEDPDKSTENQRRYDHQAREYALQNQGLTDLGNAIHNNEEFFYAFLDKKFDKNNPLNQLDLDRFLGFMTNLSTTQSCLLAALYNAYACNQKKGINGSQILDTIFDEGGNFRKAPDGKPYIDFEFNKKTGSKVPFIRGNQLGNFSWTISSVLGFSEYLQIDSTENYDSIKNDYAFAKNGLYGILKMENTNNPGNFHFVYLHNYEKIDSLPADRNKPGYTDKDIMIMILRSR